MDKVDEFFNLVDGTYQEKEDPGNPNQCMDLAFAYCDFLGIDRSAIRHLLAAEVYTQSTPLTTKNFDIIPNTPSGVPPKGSIVVFATGYNGGAGHIGVAIGIGNNVSFELFCQNDPLKSVCHVKSYPNYDFVLGWLIPKVLTTDPLVCDKKSVRDLLVTKSTSCDFIGKNYPGFVFTQDDIDSPTFGEKIIAKVKQLSDIAFTTPPPPNSTPVEVVPTSQSNNQNLAYQQFLGYFKGLMQEFLDFLNGKGVSK